MIAARTTGDGALRPRLEQDSYQQADSRSCLRPLDLPCRVPTGLCRAITCTSASAGVQTVRPAARCRPTNRSQVRPAQLACRDWGKGLNPCAKRRCLRLVAPHPRTIFLSLKCVRVLHASGMMPMELRPPPLMKMSHGQVSYMTVQRTGCGKGAV